MAEVGVQVPAVIGAVFVSLLVLALALQRAQFTGAERLRVGVTVAGFMTCSSLMLVINKVAIFQFSDNIYTVLSAQLLSTAVSIRLGGLCNIIEVEPLEWARMKQFAVIPLTVLATMWASMEILRHTNVETAILFRSAAPLATSILDWRFLNRELPSRRVVASLVATFIGALGYTMCDSELSLVTYSRPLIWLMVFLFDQIYIKHVVTVVEMTAWTRAYYTNAIACPPVVVVACLVEDMPVNFLNGFRGEPLVGEAMLLISCVVGTAMAYYSFATRAAVSATSFTVAGNACKVLSVGVNSVIWDKHASAAGLAWLGLCLLGSATYTQAPPRQTAREGGKVGDSLAQVVGCTDDEDEEEVPLTRAKPEEPEVEAEDDDSETEML